MKKNITKRIICSILGVTIIAISIPFFVQANIGADCVTLLYDALVNKTGLSLGRWTFIFSVAYLIVVFILNKKRVGIATVFYVIFSQFIIDFVVSVLPKQTTVISGILLTLVGIVICSTGTILCISGDMGCSIYDAFVFSIDDRAPLKYVYIRYLSDGIHLLIGILLGGKFGIGTIICLVAFGPVVDFLKKLLYERIKKVLE